MLKELKDCLEIIREDFRAKHDAKNLRLFRFIAYYALDTGVFAVTNYRIASFLKGIGLSGVARLLMKVTERLAFISISHSATIGPGLCIRHGLGVVIGKSVVMGCHCTVMQGTTIGGNFHKQRRDDEGCTFTQPIIGDYVHFGAGCTVLGPVRIGSQVVIGADTIITTDIPDYSVIYSERSNIRKTINPNEKMHLERFSTIFPKENKTK